MFPSFVNADWVRRHSQMGDLTVSKEGSTETWSQATAGITVPYVLGVLTGVLGLYLWQKKSGRMTP